MSYDIVPGMADAIERRSLEWFDSVEDFARAAGLTPNGLYPIRKGFRKRYTMETRIGVARALHWPPDALDRLMAGEDPEDFPTVSNHDDGNSTTFQRELVEIRKQYESMMTELRRDIRAELDALRAAIRDGEPEPRTGQHR